MATGRTRWPAAAVLGALLVASAPARAGGFHLLLLGTRRTGMLTNVANPDDVTALFHNPAGLPRQTGTRLHLSGGLAFLDSEMRMQALDPERFPAINAPDCGSAGADPCWPVAEDGYYEDSIEPVSYLGVIPYVGVSQDLRGLGGPDLPIVFSLAAYAPGAYGGVLPDDAPSAYFITEALFVIAAATAGAGWQVSDLVALGANVSYNYMRLTYARRLSTVDTLSPRGEPPTTEARLAQVLLGDMQLAFHGMDHGLGWGLGALLTPTHWLSFGASYSGNTSARFEGDLDLTTRGTSASEPLDEEQLAGLAGELGYKLPEQLEVEMPVPPAFVLGASVQPTSWLEVELDLRIFLYSLYEEQVLRPIYDPDAEGEEPLTEASLSSDKRYANSWAAALGVLVRPLGDASLDLMAGISFDKSPVPDETFSIDNPSMDQIAMALGVRAQLSESVRVGASYTCIKFLTRDVRTSETWPPTNVRISNLSHIPSVELEWLL